MTSLHTSPWLHRWAIALGAALVFVLVATPMLGRKQGYTVDATPAFQLTQAIVTTGDPFPDIAVKQGYLYSVLFIPFYALGSILAPAFPDVPVDWVQRKMMCWMNVLITAVTIALLIRLLQHLRYSSRTALCVGWLFGFTTVAFVYARTDYNKALGALLVLALFYAWTRWWQTARVSFALASGTLGGLLILLRAELGILMPILCGAMVLAPHAPRRWRDVAVFVVPVAAGSVFFLLYNWMYWDGAASGGYEGGFVANPLPGLMGFLVSPGKSLLVFCPVLFLLPLTVRSFVQRHQTPGVVWALCATATVLLYSFWGNWWGGWGFGPRHLVPLIPLLILPIAELVTHGSRGHHVALGALALGGIVVQLSGTLFDFNDIILMLVRSGEEADLSEPEMMQLLIWDMSVNPLTYHIPGIVQVPASTWDIGWVYLANRFGSTATLGLLILWLGVIGWLGRRVWSGTAEAPNG